ncbi:MAG TPA: T9SS type A sorting domain-containing protein, partial [Bacteroidales bacterium]|nr:T9SS type A sorting domain-containing protein [Bacteroidales bacterium]
IWGHKLRGTNLHSHFTSYEQIIRVDNEDVEEYALIGYCGLDGNTQDPIDEYSDILLTTIDIGGTITESTRVEFPISNTYYNIYGASIVSHGDEFGIIANWRNEANGTQIAVANLNYPDFTANWFDTLSLCNFNGCQEGIQNARRIIFNEGYYHIVGYANIDLIFANHWIEGFKIVLNPINGSIVTARVYGDIARYDTILGIIPYNSSTMLMTGYTDYWNPGTTSPWLIKVHNQPINDCLEHPVYPLSGAIDVNYEAMEGYQFNPGSSSILIAYQSQNPIADSICFSGKRDNLEKAQKSISAILNPNPTEDYVTIISDRKMISLEIFDMAGKLLKTTAVNNTEATIDVRNYSKGVYFMRIQGENSAVTRKVTVE